VKFRKWVESPDPTIVGRLDAKKVSKKGSKLQEKESPDSIDKEKQIFMNKHVIDFKLYVLFINILTDSFKLYCVLGFEIYFLFSK
jgi:hypothetical protein